MFSDDAIALIHQVARGLPRAVNNLAVQALVAAYATNKSIVDGNWQGGRNETYGLAQDGVGLGKTSPVVPPAATEAADEARQKIADGEISDIPTTVP